MFDTDIVLAKFLVQVEGRIVTYSGPIRKADFLDIEMALDSLARMNLTGPKGLNVNATTLRGKLPANIPPEGRLIHVEGVR